MGNCCCCGEADAGRKGSIRADGTYVTIPGKSSPDKAAVPGNRSCSSPSHKSAAGLEGEQSLAPCFSVLSGDEYHDCHEDCFSVEEGLGHRSELPRSSPLRSSPQHTARPIPQRDGSKDPRLGHYTNGPSESAQVSAFQHSAQCDSFHSEHVGGISDTSEEPMASAGPPAKFTLSGCLSLLGSIGLHNDAKKDEQAQGSNMSNMRHARKAGGRPEAGCSLRRHDDASCSFTDARDLWAPTPATTFMVRSLDYARTKQKVNSSEAIYRLVAVDLFSFQKKQTHVAQLVQLPAPAPQRHVSAPDTYLPPLLVVNIMLPMYAPPFFGGTNDGPGHSIVYYFALPEDFDPHTQPNPKAMGLLRRFVNGGREADGTPTRDRLKLIPRIVNAEEWAVKGPLSPAEARLLATYADKPLLTRPQQHFFSGHNYMEVDVDVHAYAFLARKAMSAFVSRLPEVVFENALVIQGNACDELPEQILGSARLYRCDFGRERPYDSFLVPEPLGVHAGQGMQPTIPEQEGEGE